MDFASFAQWVYGIFGWGVPVVAIAVCLIVQLIKKPYKRLTAKITIEKWRKLANKAIMVFAGVVALLIYWALSNWTWLISINFLGSEFVASYGVWVCAIAAGTTSIVFYAILDGVAGSSVSIVSLKTDFTAAIADGKITWEEVLAIGKDLGKVINDDPDDANKPSSNSK